MVRPFIEFLQDRLHISTTAAGLLSVNLVISASAIYELMEWVATLIFSSETGALYLGAQGDVWDAQWDVGLATLGSLIGLVAYLGMRRLRTLIQ